MKIRVKVIPSSRKKTIDLLPDGSLRVKLTAAPEKGKANHELIEILAQHFNVGRSAVTIVKGECQRVKLIEIQGAKAR